MTEALSKPWEAEIWVTGRCEHRIRGIEEI
jgi:hypothetical protein